MGGMSLSDLGSDDFSCPGHRRAIADRYYKGNGRFRDKQQ